MMNRNKERNDRNVKTSETTEKLLKFIDAFSVVIFMRCKNICVMLEDAGCIRLLENETWALEKGKRYFTTRNGSSDFGVLRAGKTITACRLSLRTAISPTFRVKSGAEITVEGHYKSSTPKATAA